MTSYTYAPTITLGEKKIGINLQEKHLEQASFMHIYSHKKVYNFVYPYEKLILFHAHTQVHSNTFTGAKKE